MSLLSNFFIQNKSGTALNSQTTAATVQATSTNNATVTTGKQIVSISVHLDAGAGVSPKMVRISVGSNAAFYLATPSVWDGSTIKYTSISKTFYVNIPTSGSVATSMAALSGSASLSGSDFVNVNYYTP